MLFQPSPLSSTGSQPTATHIHPETWWGASREFREWRLQDLGSTLKKLPQKYLEEPASPFSIYSPPAGVSVYTKQIRSVFCAAADNPTEP